MTAFTGDALLVELRDIFNDRFDSEGLESLALMLGVDYENLPGRTRKMKAQNLALHLWRHDAVSDLAVIGPAERDDIEWVVILRKYGILTEGEEHVTLGHADLQKLLPIVAGRPAFQTPDGREAALAVAGVKEFVSTDINGSQESVAIKILTQLNRYGRSSEGDYAIERFLSYISRDDSLPPRQRDVIEEIIIRNELRT